MMTLFSQQKKISEFFIENQKEMKLTLQDFKDAIKMHFNSALNSEQLLEPYDCHKIMKQREPCEKCNTDDIIEFNKPFAFFCEKCGSIYPF